MLTRRSLIGGLLATTAIPAPVVRPGVKFVTLVPRMTAGEIDERTAQWIAGCEDAINRMLEPMRGEIERAVIDAMVDLMACGRASVFVPDPA